MYCPAFLLYLYYIMMKNIFKVVFIFIAIYNISIASAQTYETSLLNSSSFKIKGSSNVNKFSFIYTSNIANGNIITLTRQDGKINVSGANKITLIIENFKSSNSMIIRDFRNMLQYKQYPYLYIELLRLFYKPDDSTKIFAMVNVTIAGNKRLEIIPFTIKNLGNQMQCTSSYKISLKRYNLVAPKKIMGFINVNDEVLLDLLLNIQYHKLK